MRSSCFSFGVRNCSSAFFCFQCRVRCCSTAFIFSVFHGVRSTRAAHVRENAKTKNQSGATAAHSIGEAKAALHGPLDSRNKPEDSRKVPFRFGLSKIKVIWASVPVEDFAMCVGQNGTQWDASKRCLQLPAGFGTEVCSGECRNLHHSRAKGRGCHKMSQNVTPEKGVFRASIVVCPKMSPNVAVPKRSFRPGGPTSGVQRFATEKRK